MIDPLQAALTVAGSGLQAQSARIRIVSENIANAQSTGATPGANPYVRKTITFNSALDKATGVPTVQVREIGFDPSAFPVVHDPGNPAADINGAVKMPNVNILTEVADMREANHSYEADLQVSQQARQLISMTIDLLRNSS